MLLTETVGPAQRTSENIEDALIVQNGFRASCPQFIEDTQEVIIVDDVKVWLSFGRHFAIIQGFDAGSLHGHFPARIFMAKVSWDRWAACTGFFQQFLDPFLKAVFSFSEVLSFFTKSSARCWLILWLRCMATKLRGDP